MIAKLYCPPYVANDIIRLLIIKFVWLIIKKIMSSDKPQIDSEYYE